MYARLRAVAWEQERRSHEEACHRHGWLDPGEEAVDFGLELAASTAPT